MLSKCVETVNETCAALSPLVSKHLEFTRPSGHRTISTRGEIPPQLIPPETPKPAPTLKRERGRYISSLAKEPTTNIYIQTPVMSYSKTPHQQNGRIQGRAPRALPGKLGPTFTYSDSNFFTSAGSMLSDI